MNESYPFGASLPFEIKKNLGIIFSLFIYFILFIILVKLYISSRPYSIRITTSEDSADIQAKGKEYSPNFIGAGTSKYIILIALIVVISDVLGIPLFLNGEPQMIGLITEESQREENSYLQNL